MTNLRFRKISETDLEQLRVWRMDPAVTRFLFTDPVITSEAQKQWFETVKDGENYRSWIVEYEGADVGFVTLSSIDWTNRRADPGVFICNPAARGKGLARHIMLNVQRHAFEEMGLHKLYGPIMAANSSAVAAYMKAGYALEGYFHDHVFKDGKFWDVVMIGMVEERWRRLSSESEYDRGEFEKY